MDTSKKGQQKYAELVKKVSPNSPVFGDCIKAFVSGGIICTIGQLLLDFYIGICIEIVNFLLTFLNHRPHRLEEELLEQQKQNQQVGKCNENLPQIGRYDI